MDSTDWNCKEGLTFLKSNRNSIHSNKSYEIIVTLRRKPTTSCPTLSINNTPLILFDQIH